MTITIDAYNKILGRLATEIAGHLLGKNKPDFVPYKITGDTVTVKNIEGLQVTGDKLDTKKYYRHTLYPGHLRSKKMDEFSKEDLLKKAVLKMLPKNKLRKERMKMLTIEINKML